MDLTRTRTARIITLAGILGALAVGLCLAFPLIIGRSSAEDGVTRFGELSPNIQAIRPSVAGAASTPSGLLTFSASIRYPIGMRESDSEIVTVRLDGGRGKELDSQLSKDTTLQILGAAFDIAPGIAVTRAEGVSLPTEWCWSITPRKAGAQMLLLDLNEVREAIEQDSFGVTFPFMTPLLGEDGELLAYLTPEGSWNYELPIEVRTQEGLPLRWFLILRYGFGILGFILLYPVVITQLTKLVKRKKAKEPVGSD